MSRGISMRNFYFLICPPIRKGHFPRESMPVLFLNNCDFKMACAHIDYHHLSLQTSTLELLPSIVESFSKLPPWVDESEKPQRPPFWLHLVTESEVVCLSVLFGLNGRNIVVASLLRKRATTFDQGGGSRSHPQVLLPATWLTSPCKAFIVGSFRHGR